MAKGGSDVKPPEFVVELVKRVVEEKSQGAGAGAPGLALLAVRRYLKGTGEPSQAALDKLAAYFGVSAAWLRRDFLVGKNGAIDFNLTAPTALCAKCGGELQASSEGFGQILADGSELAGDGILRLWPCNTCCK